MRLIGVTKDEQKLSSFATWLATQGIDTKVGVDEDGNSEIWVKEEDHFRTTLEAFNQFLINPDNPKYADAVEATHRRIQDEEKQRREDQQRKLTEVSQRRSPVVGIGPMTKTVMILCLLVAILTNFGDPRERDQGANRALQFLAVDRPQSTELEALFQSDRDSLQVRLASILSGEVWRLVTPIFIHYGLSHFLLNMLMFVQFGRMVEERYGTVWLGVLVVVTAIVSNSAQAIVPADMGGAVPGFSSGIIISRFGGLSGVIFGAFGFVLIKQYLDPSSGFFLPQLTIALMLGYMVFCMLPISGEMGLQVANWCHGIGFVTGAALATRKPAQ